MKVCMLISFPSREEIEQHKIGNGYVINLVDALIDQSNDLNLTIFAQKSGDEKKQRYRRAKIERIWRMGRLNPFRIFKALLHLRPDLFHIQYDLAAQFGKGLFLINPFILMVLARISRVPLFITIHHVIPPDEVGVTFKRVLKGQKKVEILLYAFGYKFLTRFIGKIATQVIVLDEGTRKWAIKQYGYSKEKIKLIPHGMYIPPIRVEMSEAKKILKINKEYNVLLLFGSIHPRKGVEYAIKALPYVLKKHPNTILMVAGGHSRKWKKQSYSYLSFLKDLGKNLGLEDYLVFDVRDRPIGKEIPTLFGAADIVVLPYVIPGKAIPKLAASYKKPVIITSSLSRKGEVINGITGVLLPTLNEKILAQKIVVLLNDKSKALNMAKKFYERNLKTSEWKKVAQETLDYYRTVRVTK